MKKHSCGGVIERSTAILGDYIIDADVCKRCHESQPDLMQAQLVLAHNRFSAEPEMEGSVTTVGTGSIALRIPIELARSYMLASGGKVGVKSVAPGQLGVRVNDAAKRIRPLFDEKVKASAAFAILQPLDVNTTDIGITIRPDIADSSRIQGRLYEEEELGR